MNIMIRVAGDEKKCQIFSKLLYLASLTFALTAAASIKNYRGILFLFSHIWKKNKKFKRFYFLDDNIFSDFFVIHFSFSSSSLSVESDLGQWFSY